MKNNTKQYICLNINKNIKLKLINIVVDLISFDESVDNVYFVFIGYILL